jgi:hypothetical protein
LVFRPSVYQGSKGRKVGHLGHETSIGDKTTVLRDNGNVVQEFGQEGQPVKAHISESVIGDSRGQETLDIVDHKTPKPKIESGRSRLGVEDCVRE